MKVETTIVPISQAGRITDLHDRGFAYVMLLVAVLVLAITSSAAVLLTSRILQAEREAELLFRGMAYRDAIERYYFAANRKVLPQSLESLLKDPRFAFKRHIRRLYVDPVSESGEWRLVRDRTGGVVGVASTSDKTPLKQEHFPKGLEHLAGSEKYSDWVFEFRPPVPAKKTSVKPPVKSR